MDKLKIKFTEAIQWLWSKKFVSNLIGVGSGIFCFLKLDAEARPGQFPILLIFIATLMTGYNYFNVREKIKLGCNNGNGKTENKT